MNKNTGIILGLIVLAIVVVGVYTSTNGKSDVVMMEKESVEQKAMANKVLLEEKQVVDEKAMMEEKSAKEKTTMEQKGTEEKASMEDTNAVTKDDGAMMQKEDVMMEKKDETQIIASTDTMMKVGVYEKYNPEKIVKASTEDVVLFFKADWCPSCRAVDADIKANLTRIPSGINILEVNYDSSTELKNKYGVTYQHTFVQVDASGTLIKKWSGSRTLSELVKEVQ